MIDLQALLAQADPNAITRLWKSGAWGEVAMLFIAIAGVTILVLLWAFFIRKRKRLYGQRHHRHRHHHHSETPGNAEATAAQSKDSGRKRRRRRHRTMNPTLAQTGGLPPARPDTDEPDSVRAE